MKPANPINTALYWVMRYHSSQADKSGSPFILHPIRVGMKFWQDPVMCVAGLLHDLVEDTPKTLEDVEWLFGAEVRELVDQVTRRKDETYKDFIERCRVGDTRGIQIKLADLEDNLLPERQNFPGAASLGERHQAALNLLRFELAGRRTMDYVNATLSPIARRV